MVLLDPADRVLLVEERGADGVAGRFHHWLTPGGGVEDGEALVDAAVREVVEETGVRIALAAEAPVVHRQRRRWSWGGVTYDQVDHFFAARVGAAFEPRPTALTEMERQTVVGARWWRLEELRASDATFLPPDIADVLVRLAVPGVLRAPTLRPAGRALVVDARGRTLMISIRQGPGSEELNWISPGGGTEPGEIAAQAAVRELAEETGLHTELPADAEPVAVERAVFGIGPDFYVDQTDEYFLVRVADAAPAAPEAFTELERSTVLEFRWWSAAEIRASGELFWPVGLADLLDRVVDRRA